MKDTGAQGLIIEAAGSTAKGVQDPLRQIARILAQIPVLICTYEKNGGRPFYEECRAVQVSPQGALLKVARTLVPGQSLVLIHPKSGKEMVCQIVSAQPEERGFNEIEIKFPEESPDFWGADHSSESDGPSGGTGSPESEAPPSGGGAQISQPEEELLHEVSLPLDEITIDPTGIIVAQQSEGPPPGRDVESSHTKPSQDEGALQARPAPEQLSELTSAFQPEPTPSLRGSRRGLRIRYECGILISFPGEATYEESKTLQVGEYGALLACHRNVAIGQSLLLIHPISLNQIASRVRYQKTVQLGMNHIGVEFESASSDFWGIPIPSGDPDVSGLESEDSGEQSGNASFRADEKQVQEHAPGEAPKISGGANLTAVEAWEEPEGAFKEFLKRWGYFVWPSLAFAGICGSIFLYNLQHRKPAPAVPDPAASSLPQEITPEEARLIPETENYRLARTDDFNPDAVTWLTNSGQRARGKIDGSFSAFGPSSAYVLIGKNKLRRIVILANQELRCDVKYRAIAIVARVPKDLAGAIVWDSPPPADTEGDGLLVVRSANDPGSSDVLFLRGNAVVSGTPANYQQVLLIPAP